MHLGISQTSPRINISIYAFCRFAQNINKFSSESANSKKKVGNKFKQLVFLRSASSHDVVNEFAFPEWCFSPMAQSRMHDGIPWIQIISIVSMHKYRALLVWKLKSERIIEREKMSFRLGSDISCLWEKWISLLHLWCDVLSSVYFISACITLPFLVIGSGMLFGFERLKLN